MAKLIALILCSVLLSAPTLAVAQQSSPPIDTDAIAIQRVIESQIEAFQRDDAAVAYGYASPAIQRIFPNPAIFMQMVRSGYRPVYRPQSFEFQELALIDGQIVQQVLFVGPDGQLVMALYSMQLQDGGRWRINGVRLITLPGETAGRTTGPV